MPELKHRREILNYVTPQELESRYVRIFQSLGYPLSEAIAAGKERVRLIQFGGKPSKA